MKIVYRTPTHRFLIDQKGSKITIRYQVLRETMLLFWLIPIHEWINYGRRTDIEIHPSRPVNNGRVIPNPHIMSYRDGGELQIWQGGFDLNNWMNEFYSNYLSAMEYKKACNDLTEHQLNKLICE